MKAKKRFVIASAVFAGINLLIFVALFVCVAIWNKTISSFVLEEVQKVSTESDFGYWLVNSVNNNMAVIMLLFIIIIFLLCTAKTAIFYHFVKYAKFGMKDFYTRRTKYLTMVLLQLLLIGTFFGMLMGVIAIVIQKALVTPQNVDQVLNETWGQEETIPGMDKNNNTNNKPVVRVGPNARFVENISQLRDGVRYLAEAGLISKGQRNSLNKKIDKLSKDKARKKEMQAK